MGSFLYLKNDPMKRKLLIFSALLFGLTNCEDGVEPIRSVDQLEAKLQNLAATSTFPGFSVAIVGPDSVVYQHGFGYANLSTRTPFTTATVQPVASVSKTLIANALLKLVEQGQLTLETNINDVLPFRVVNPHQPNAIIRVRHLVTHTSGIVDREEAYKQAYEEGPRATTSLGGYLADYFTSTGSLYSADNFSNSAPGAKYHYSNVASALAAYLVEVKVGESFANYTQRVILDAVPLTHASWVYEDDQASQYATLYNEQHQPYPLYSLVTYPDGGLRASCQDLSRYLLEMIRGHAGQSRLLTPASFQTLFSPQFGAGTTPTNLPEKQPNIGIFWAFNRSGRIGHTGSDPGTTTFVSFDPAKRTGRVLLINSDVESEKQQEQYARIVAVLQNFENNWKQ